MSCEGGEEGGRRRTWRIAERTAKRRTVAILARSSFTTAGFVVLFSATRIIHVREFWRCVTICARTS